MIWHLPVVDLVFSVADKEKAISEKQAGGAQAPFRDDKGSLLEDFLALCSWSGMVGKAGELASDCCWLVIILVDTETAILKEEEECKVS